MTYIIEGRAVYLDISNTTPDKIRDQITKQIKEANDPDVKVEDGKIVGRIERTKIIGSGWAMHVDDTPDAGAAEINHQIKEE